MLISDSTQASLAAKKYIKQFLTLNEEGFRNSLDDAIVCIHTRVKDGKEQETVQLNGKEAVSKAYKDNFFSITSNFDLHKDSYVGLGLQAQIECEVSEDKQEVEIVRRYFLISHIELNFKKDDSGHLKITKIWEKTSKTLL